MERFKLGRSFKSFDEFSDTDGIALFVLVYYTCFGVKKKTYKEVRWESECSLAKKGLCRKDEILNYMISEFLKERESTKRRRIIAKIMRHD